MNKVILATAVHLSATACSKPGVSADADGGAVAASTSSSTSPIGSLVDKALSFVSTSPFEGEITMNVSDTGKPPHTIVYDVKGTKMRFDAPSDAAREGGGYMIFDSAAKKMTTVTDAKKMAFTIDMNKAPSADPTAASAKKPMIDKTGKTDTVAGYSCEIWNVSEDADKAEVCVAKGIAFPMMGRHATGWQSELNDAFPLRAITKDATGTEKARMEVTKIEKKTIDDARFEVPAGYNTMSMDDMMKGLGAGMRPHR